MDLIFRGGASNREKIFTLLILSWMGATVFGFYSGFVPTQEARSLATYLWLPATILCFVPIALDKHPEGIRSRFRGPKRLLSYCFTLIFVGFLAFYGLIIGIPSVATLVINDNLSKSFVVIEKGDGRFRWRDRCESYKVVLEQANKAFRTTICPGKDIWMEMQVGKKLEVTVKRSVLGSMITELR